MVKKTSGSKKKAHGIGSLRPKKAASMPELGECSGNVRSGRILNLPKISKSRENFSASVNQSVPITNSTTGLSSPGCLRILEKLSELITNPWSPSHPTGLPPRPPSSTSSRSSASTKTESTSVRRASDPPFTSARWKHDKRKTRSYPNVGLARRESDGSLPELSIGRHSVRRRSGSRSGDDDNGVEVGGSRLRDGSGPVDGPRSAPGTPPISADVRNKIGKQFLALKRLMDKEGVHAEDSVFKVIPKYQFAGQVSSDICIIITNLLIRLTTTTDSNANNTAFMAKKGLAVALLKCLQSLHGEYLSGDIGVGPPNHPQRVDELMGNLFVLVVRVAKYDSKIPLLARLHCAVPTTIMTIRRWNERKEYGLMMHGFQALRIYATKNENNVVTIIKSNIATLMATMIKSPTSPIKLDCLLDLLTILAKSKPGAIQILSSFTISHLISIFKNASTEAVQRAVLKLLKAIVETDEGKKAFVEDNGIAVLTEALDGVIQASESSPSQIPTGQNTIPTLLVTLLRSAVSQTDLPFLERYQYLSFPLPLATEESGDNAEAKPDVDDDENPPLRQFCPELELHDGIPSMTPLPMGNIQVRHVQPMSGRHLVSSKCVAETEGTYKRPSNLVRKSVYDQMTRVLHPNASQNQLVYDVMDETIAAGISGNTLQFESRFESGNLQMAVKISDYEYDLLLQTDINSSPGKHNQWFYFCVQRMVPNTPYKFNIVNMSKPNSQFNQGMQPVMFSREDGCWRRVGDAIYYYKNHYAFPTQYESDCTFATLTFTIVFSYAGDSCYFAYHYPYTYSDLQRSLFHLQLSSTFGERCRRQTLCRTLGGNECPLLTVTDFSPASTTTNPISDRVYILLSARVHPGESNSSHIMHGLLNFLLSDAEMAIDLRKRCVFKIIPMLNPDGVVNGSHRCSLAGVDLNRQWKRPDRKRAPTIWWVKRLWKFLVDEGKRALLTCDFHGHSRRKNMFIFGCENTPGSDAENLEKTFPTLISTLSPTFDMSLTRFDVTPSKESTARVVLWREMGILNSFTLESSYCGGDFGEKKGLQFQPSDLRQAGIDFCRALRAFLDIPPWNSSSPFPTAAPLVPSARSASASVVKSSVVVESEIGQVEAEVHLEVSVEVSVEEGQRDTVP
ncbi:hypothetical protein SpCBS45565_g03896 [Spizellomyces sp. 'palustris']|nr:hypothetical protein SpCBS45565_g03896 [Spizellomyces sp. 'palustris']